MYPGQDGKEWSSPWTKSEVTICLYTGLFYKKGSYHRFSSTTSHNGGADGGVGGGTDETRLLQLLASGVLVSRTGVPKLWHRQQQPVCGTQIREELAAQ